jgi:predicted 3-demethylubiquinone-9 3-methyltransferase (glyoxalase superfamily)
VPLRAAPLAAPRLLWRARSIGRRFGYRLRRWRALRRREAFSATAIAASPLKRSRQRSSIWALDGKGGVPAEAVEHYLSIFKNGEVLEVTHYGDAVPSLKGKLLTMRFVIEGQEFLALNGGLQFPFTEAISIAVDCADQAEVDRLWTRLSEGGSTGQCGWLKDKFGLSWQIVPRAMIDMLKSPDTARAQRAMAAMMHMTKLDIAALQGAFDGK